MKKRSTFLELKESEREYRRKIILEAAVSLFSSHSFYEIGMRDIAEEAGISPASIYRYFSSRDHILAEILAIEAMEAKKRQFNRVKGKKASLEEIARGIVDFFLERESTLQMIGHFLLNRDLDPEARERFLKIQHQYMEEFNRLLIQGGLVKEKADIFSRTFFGSLLGLIISQKARRGEDRTRKEIHHMAKMTAHLFQGYIQGQGKKMENRSAPEGADQV